MSLARLDSNRVMSLDTVLVAVTDDDQSALIDAVLDVAVPTGASVARLRQFGPVWMAEASDVAIDSFSEDRSP